jgi:hypothetical protein
MARGWGRSEEEQGAEKEQARDERRSEEGTRRDAVIESRRRSLKLSLARIEELLAKTQSSARREALESARTEILERLEGL